MALLLHPDSQRNGGTSRLIISKALERDSRAVPGNAPFKLDILLCLTLLQAGRRLLDLPSAPHLSVESCQEASFAKAVI